MPHMITPDTLDRALRAAIRRHCLRRQAERDKAAAGRAFRLLFCSLGFPVADLDRLSAATASRQVPERLKAEMDARLRLEAGRLLRLARIGAPAYDVNRHMAVSRAMAWLDGGDRPCLEPDRLSGKVLNARFRKRRRRSPEAPATEGLATAGARGHQGSSDRPSPRG